MFSLKRTVNFTYLGKLKFCFKILLRWKRKEIGRYLIIIDENWDRYQ